MANEKVESKVPSTEGKYEAMAKAKGNKKGADGKPLIAKGKAYEITVNPKK